MEECKSAIMSYRQYELESQGALTTGWIDTKAPLSVGQRLTTKEHGPDVIWTVRAVGSTTRDDPPNQRWQVGGLR